MKTIVAAIFQFWKEAIKEITFTFVLMPSREENFTDSTSAQEKPQGTLSPIRLQGGICYQFEVMRRNRSTH